MVLVRPTVKVVSVEPTAETLKFVIEGVELVRPQAASPAPVLLAKKLNPSPPPPQAASKERLTAVAVAFKNLTERDLPTNNIFSLVFQRV